MAGGCQGLRNMAGFADYLPNSDKPKLNWNRKDAKVAKIYFFFAFLASSRFEKIFAFCALVCQPPHNRV